MDERLDAIAAKVASHLWRSARASDQRGFDLEDLRQEARLAAWSWWAKHPDCLNTAESSALAFTVIRCDTIDAMRRMNKCDPASASPRPLDATQTETDDDRPTIADALPDAVSEQMFSQVEAVEDVRLAFRQYRGSPRAAAAAWLHLQGVPANVVGAHLGITANRVWELRKAFIAATARRWAESGREDHPAST